MSWSADLETAAALEDNVFYHVILKKDLLTAAREGLRPGEETGRDNFPDFVGKDRECVYLWPNVMAALSWSREDHEQRFRDQERVVVRVSGIDLERVFPDHEEFDRFLEEPESFPDGESIYQELCQRGLWNDEQQALRAARAHKDHSIARDLLRNIHDDLRLRLVNSFADYGQALMHRGPIAVERLELVELNEWERLQEAFDADYGSPYQGEADPTPEEEEAYEAALELHFDGRELIDEATLKDLLEDIDSWPSNEQERFFSFQPLPELALELAGERPELSRLADSAVAASTAAPALPEAAL